MKVIILAAGEGRRMKEVFPDTPKGLIPVEGKPIIEYLVEQYKDFEVLLNVRSREADRFKYLGLPLLEEETPLGNAGAIKYFIKELGDKFIAVHTDVYSDIDPHELKKAHKGVATMTVKDLADPKDFGVVTHTGDLVTGFTRERLVNCGMYVFSREIADYITDGFQDLDRDLFPKLIGKQKLHFYRHEGKWNDVGRAEYWRKEKKK